MTANQIKADTEESSSPAPRPMPDLMRLSYEGWKEAAIAWAVCSSIHHEYAKGKDALYSTRHQDYERYQEDARRQAFALQELNELTGERRSETQRLREVKEPDYHERMENARERLREDGMPIPHRPLQLPCLPKIVQEELITFHALKDWLCHHGLLRLEECTPAPGMRHGEYWVLRAPWIAKGEPEHVGTTVDEVFQSLRNKV